MSVKENPDRKKKKKIFFVSTWDNLRKHCISARFLLLEGYVQGALQKELHIAPFVERFKTTTLGKSQ